MDGGGARGTGPGMPFAGVTITAGAASTAGATGADGATDAASTAGAGFGVRGSYVQSPGGGTALGTVRAQQPGGHTDQPGPDTRRQGQSDMAGDLAETLRHEQRRGTDEGEHHVPRRTDAAGVAHRLLHGRHERADGDQHDGVRGDRRRDQGDGEAADHAEHDPGEGAGAGGVGPVVAVERAQRAGHRVHGQVEVAERQQGQVGRGDRGDRAQCGLEPDVGGPPETERTGEGKTVGGRTAHINNLACVSHMFHL